MAETKFRKLGRRSPSEYSLEIEYSCMFGNVLSWHPQKLTICWLVLFILLTISYSSKEPDVEGEALIDFLKVLNDSKSQISDWNDNLVSPCFSWSHITCRNGNVISLSLGSKGFSGTLSPSITKLKFLVSLELQDNNLSGVLPDYLASMAQLQNLNLANNNFSGSIPTTWGQLPSLKHLVLRGNHLSGTIPDSIANITGLTELDLSSNDLSGRIPLQLFSILSFNFTGTRLNCDPGIEQPCVSRPPLPVSTRKSKFGVVVASAICGAFLLLSLGVVFAYLHHYVHKLRHDVFVDVADLKPGEKGLDWPTRKRVALGAAHGLEYLHEHCNPKIIHRDLKAANILLDDDFEPVLGDFGLAKLVDTKLTHVTTQVRGTMGHIAPEYLHTGKSSEKTDVFGYGITLLELVTGQRAVDLSRLEEEEDVLLLDHII
ncbi:hypothetical protein I3760_03G107000 [Carya illinoinensis]|nr:hypothetical protein I3760_03G107000 [Carya illinoinensis]KAG2716068.1 hypothetical protein I3760_03G107000 [Carya illinoinensis]